MSKIERFKNFVKKHSTKIVICAAAGVGVIIGCTVLNKNDVFSHSGKASPDIDAKIDAKIDGMIEMGSLGLLGEVLKVEKNSSREVFGHGNGQYTLADLGKWGKDLVDHSTDKVPYSLDDKLTGVLVFVE